MGRLMSFALCFVTCILASQSAEVDFESLAKSLLQEVSKLKATIKETTSRMQRLEGRCGVWIVLIDT